MSIFDKKLSVIMPCYNEGNKIFANIQTTEKLIGSFQKDFELIVVDDGSKDNTKEEIQKALVESKKVKMVSYSPNRGKGWAIKRGVAESSGEFIAFLDADLDLSPLHIKDFMIKMEQTGVQVVIGSKMHKDSQVNYPKRRKIMSFGYYVMLLILFHLPVKDTQTGVKLFKADCLKQVIGMVQSTGFAYDIEILAHIVKNGGKIAEMPVILEFQRENRWGRIRLKDIFEVAYDTWKIFFSVHRKRK